jgi:type IV pilus assembly protein PilA
MRKIQTRCGGFSLIELMIVVAIIGILTAIAIPNFLKFQLRSKAGEAKTNLAAMRTAEEGYFAEYAIYIGTGIQSPATPPTAAKQPWPALVPDFDTLGWLPEGDVYFVYLATVGGSAFSLGAQGDLDGGGATSDFGYIHPDSGGFDAGDPFGGGCVGGVFDAANPGVPMTNAVGPCTRNDGQNDF